MKHYPHPTREQLNLACVLHALSDPVRLEYVRCLSASACEKACGAVGTTVAKSTLSHHLRVLREAGIVRIRTEGTQSLISIRWDDLEARFPGVVTSILKVVEATAEAPVP
jgi:DNA-binding transcriptional ArsR family regulator